jgi:hypothetical protein
VARKLNDWLTSYLEYAKDGFCPDQFHFWVGISVIAAALERKVWVARESFNLYPNLYVILVSRPGVGKSSAANIGVNEFLRRLKFGGQDSINFLSVQNSEASFVDQAALYREFVYNDSKHVHSSSFFYASEASNSLKEMVGGGSVNTCLTDFYDCPLFWKKKLVSKEVNIKNCCTNLLACSTFSFLRKLVPQEEAEGGFASRLLFVIQKDLFVRTPTWNAKGKDLSLQRNLLEDLVNIHTMTGPIMPTKEFSRAYEEWFPLQDKITQNYPSDRMQHFMARKHTNLLKLAMICSVSESASKQLTLAHWDRAKELYAEVEKNLPTIVEMSIDNRESKSVNYRILRNIEKNGKEISKVVLIGHLNKHGYSLNQITNAISSLIQGGDIELSGGGYKLLGDPNKYL